MPLGKSRVNFIEGKCTRVATQFAFCETLHKRCLELLLDMCGVAVKLVNNVCIMTSKVQRICLWSKILLQKLTLHLFSIIFAIKLYVCILVTLMTSVLFLWTPHVHNWLHFHNCWLVGHMWGNLSKDVVIRILRFWKRICRAFLVLCLWVGGEDIVH